VRKEGTSKSFANIPFGCDAPADYDLVHNVGACAPLRAESVVLMACQPSSVLAESQSSENHTTAASSPPAMQQVQSLIKGRLTNS